MAVERCIIIGSGPAGWSAAIYASRANLEPLVFEGANHRAERIQGTLPLGQLAQTTEVENFAGFPSGNLKGFLESAIDPNRVMMMPPIEEHAHAVTGPELMELMRQQATNFGTRIITDDVVSVDFSKRPFTLNTLESGSFQAKTVIIATGARANYLGLPSEEAFKNRGCERLCGLRRRLATLPQETLWLSVVVIPLSKKPAICQVCFHGPHVDTPRCNASVEDHAGASQGDREYRSPLAQPSR